ncbi:MAG TPA: DUF4352 domain-containing protein [Actinomycetales bacterium]|nr:DUF4352 domain-containing protein [Actinomycetales bacterium]
MFARHRSGSTGPCRKAARAGIAVLAAGALILVGCGDGGGDAAAPAGEKRSPAPGSTSGVPRLAAVGDEVVADGITVTVDEVTARDDFRTGAGGDGATEDAAAGKTFVFVHATIENTGDDDIAPVCGDVIATLADDDGVHDTVRNQDRYVANPPCDEGIAPGDDGPAIFIFEVREDGEPTEFHFRLRDHADDRANTVAIDDLGAEPADRAAHPSRDTATGTATTRRTSPATPSRTTSTPARICEEGSPGGYDYERGGYRTCVNGQWEIVPGPPPPDDLYPPEGDAGPGPEGPGPEEGPNGP